jgi:sodium/proline symporter
MIYLSTALAFTLYLLVLILIGVCASIYSPAKKDTSNTGFIIGSRSFGYWITAISAQASDMSNWLLMGFPALIYQNGLVEYWTAIGLVGGMFLNWKFIAPRLREQTEKYNAVTLSSYFEKRFNDTSGILRLFSAFMILLFFSLYLSSNIKGIGYVLRSAFDVDYTIGSLLGVLAVICYTLVGGFVAVAWTDLFQGLFLLVVIMIVPFYALSASGGFSALLAMKDAQPNFWSLIPSLHGAIVYKLQAIGWGLGYFGMPHILNKFMAAKDTEELRKAKYVGIIWQILALSAAASIGLVGRIFFQNNSLGNTELIFIDMAQQLFTPFIAGLVLCAILAAIISTVDSQVLVLAGAVANDVYRKTFNAHASQKRVLFVYRLSIVVFMAIAYILAFNETKSIYALVEAAWSGLGSAFGPLVLMALFSRSANRYGAIAGMLVGGLSAGWWSFYGFPICGFAVPAMIIGFSKGLATIALVSYLTKHKA